MTATYGIDLASQPRKTAACMIEWDHGRGRVCCPGEGVTDRDIIGQVGQEYVSSVAIDAPFGWPSTFRDAVNGFHGAASWPDSPGEQAAQELMRLRVTDRAVHEETMLTPLSVSSDRIAIVAMRCARLLSTLWRQPGRVQDRAGLNGIAEVYPAAALVQWGLSQRAGVADPGTYKGNDPAARIRRGRIFDAIANATHGWLEMHEKVRIVCIANDDCLDALICALIARAVELGRVLPVADPQAAADEGWIRLPLKEPLSALQPADERRPPGRLLPGAT